MSMIYHRVVVATVPMALLGKTARRERWPGHDIPDRLAEFAFALPAQYRPLLIGPIPHDVNGGQTWFFSTAGSKGGHLRGNEVHQWQERFIAIFTRPECREADGTLTRLCTVVTTRWPEDPAYGRTSTRRRV